MRFINGGIPGWRRMLVRESECKGPVAQFKRNRGLIVRKWRYPGRAASVARDTRRFGRPFGPSGRRTHVSCPGAAGFVVRSIFYAPSGGVKHCESIGRSATEQASPTRRDCNSLQAPAGTSCRLSSFPTPLRRLPVLPSAASSRAVRSACEPRPDRPGVCGPARDTPLLSSFVLHPSYFPKAGRGAAGCRPGTAASGHARRSVGPRRAIVSPDPVRPARSDTTRR